MQTTSPPLFFFSFSLSLVIPLKHLLWFERAPLQPLSASPLCQRSASRRQFLLYRSPAPKSVDQIQHRTHQRLTNQSAEGVVSRWWSGRPVANERAVWTDKELASMIVGRLNGTLFMSTLSLFKETRCGEIAASLIRKKIKNVADVLLLQLVLPCAEEARHANLVKVFFLNLCESKMKPVSPSTRAVPHTNPG